MKIPDETLYRDRNKRLQDFTRFKLCLRCTHCPINTQSQILLDGEWYCSYHDKWFEANDLLRYRCYGYREKKCVNCGNKKFCDYKDKENPKKLACTKYRLTGSHPRNFISGKALIKENDSDMAYMRELEYLERKKGEYENGIINELGRISEIKKGIDTRRA